MTSFGMVPLAVFFPAALALYALAFLAGGISYLEQRAARIRDQFPRQALLARLTGYAALCIGLLASISVGGCLSNKLPDFRQGGLIATVAGIGFWIFRMHFDPTPLSRLRNATLLLICSALSVLAWFWLRTA